MHCRSSLSATRAYSPIKEEVIDTSVSRILYIGLQTIHLEKKTPIRLIPHFDACAGVGLQVHTPAS
jgi:hypothetical protein